MAYTLLFHLSFHIHCVAIAIVFSPNLVLNPRTSRIVEGTRKIGFPYMIVQQQQKKKVRKKHVGVKGIRHQEDNV